MITPEFKQAVQDYSQLLEKRYPRKQILKLIGDRYLLDKAQRTMLSRGVFLYRDVENRQSKKVATIAGQILHVDTCNVLFSIANYLLGRLVFISNDGFIRDAGEVYDKLQTHEKFYQSMNLVMEYLVREGVSAAHFYIDEPVTDSVKLEDQLRQLIGLSKLDGVTILCRKPDNELMKVTKGVICTSDSVIMDETRCTLADIPYGVLNENFDLDIIDLAGESS
ncbi:MAG: DUF434 domain-containing protein [Bacteroidales bacterium]|nr:DUF434 domain-containing protein [Bacteroidales bacterium]